MSGGEASCDEPWKQEGGVVLYCVVMLYMFYGLAMVCDEYFVPALNVLCERLKIPDNVAGATFMAAGASSPEVFASAIGLFVTKSAVGAGTVVGSELFNMLMICGASAIIMGGTLELDWRPLVREVIFYALSLGLLVATLFDEVVTWWESLLLLVSYALYVFSCAKFDWLVSLFCGGSPNADPLYEPLLTEAGGSVEGSVNMSLTETQASSSNTVRASLESRSRGPSVASSRASQEHAAETLAASIATTSPSDLSKKEEKRRRLTSSGTILGLDYGDCTMHGFMYKKSRFYTKMLMSSHMWKKRWFILDDNMFWYCKNPLNPNKGARRVDIETATDVKPLAVDEFTLESASQTYHFRVNRPEQLVEWVNVLKDRVEIEKSKREAEMTKEAELGFVEVKNESNLPKLDVEVHHNPLQWPSEFWSQVAYVLVFPLNVIFVYSIPNVKNPKLTNYYPLTFAVSVLWLGALAYCMIYAADQFGCIVKVTADFVGLTITAAGTSFPNLVASMLVARQGLGNMAVSNAFGSNVFNVFVGLGLPWFVQTAIVEPGVDYKVEAGSIFGSVLLLAGCLMIFIAAVGYLRLSLSVQFGWLCVFVYLIFLVYQILVETNTLPKIPKF